MKVSQKFKVIGSGDVKKVSQYYQLVERDTYTFFFIISGMICVHYRKFSELITHLLLLYHVF